MDYELELIRLYLTIFELFKKRLGNSCERLANHADLSFTDEEVVCVFMWGVIQKRNNVKDIFSYAKNHLMAYFPKMPGYEAFNHRLNRLSNIFQEISEMLKEHIPKAQMQKEIGLIDSLPIEIAKQKRSDKAKVAKELASKGYCASKGVWYYGR